MHHKILNLIKYIVCYATDHDISLTTIRLVKFIYLADLYNARLKDGETITKFPWAFVYYGPYCRNVMEGIDEAILKGYINSKTMESRQYNKDYRLFACNDDRYSEIKKEFPFPVISELQYAIKKYGDDTALLLDYVYFDTEPMNDVKKGDLLDFSLARQPEPIPAIETKKIAKKDIDKIKMLINKLKEKHAAAEQNLINDNRETEKWQDDLYYKSLDKIESEPLETGLKGISRIDI